MNGTGGGVDKEATDSRHLKRAAGLIPIQAWVPKDRKDEALSLLDPLVKDGKDRVGKLKAERRKERRAARLRAELAGIGK